MDAWPALLERAVARHGGWESWRALQTIDLRLLDLGGPLPFLKGVGKTFRPPETVRVWPHRQRVLFDGSDTYDGTATAHRATFRGLRKLRRWSRADACYFFGYSLVTYLSLPFVLADCRFVRMRRWRDLDGATVDFPDGFTTHSRRQSFFFDRDGLLLRHDYTADVVGRWAKGSHFSSDYVTVSGMPFARRRRVVATLFGHPTPLPVLAADLDGFAVDA